MGRETEALQNVRLGLFRRTDQKEAVSGIDPVTLGLADCVLDLLQRLLLLEPVEYLLVPASTPKARKLQLALTMSGNWSTATESTRPSQPQRNSSLRSMIPWQISRMRLRFSRKWSSVR